MPRLDLLSDGLNSAVAVNYFYEEPKGECEKNTLCDWEISKDGKNWSSFKTGNSRYLPLTVNEREQWLRVKITPKSGVNETGTGRESVGGT